MYIIHVYYYYELILQVSLVVKIEVEACSYRAPNQGRGAFMYRVQCKLF